ncbi:hypothetical protein EEL32_16835 [Brevibacillus laterosporus]|nr:hypothetical protein [Brevibacillus laterosporus]TPG84182.1 hypothetical protein EEL32_16835 [Brevibacillus laterosporus]
MAKKHYELLIQGGKIVGVSKTFGYGPTKRLKHGRSAILLRTMEDALQALENAAAGEFVPITAHEASLIEEVTQDTFLDVGPEAVVYVEDIVARLEENRMALRDTQIRNGLPTLNSPEDGQMLYGAFIITDDDSEAVVVWADSKDDAESRLRTAGYVQIEDIEEVGDDGMFGM